MSTTYAYTAQQAITAALRILGIYTADSGAPSAADLADGLEALNLFVKSLASKGAKIWLVNQVTIPLTLGTLSFTLGPTGTVPLADRPLKLTSVVIRDATSSIDVPMINLTRDEYMSLGAKSSQGMPTQYYYDPTMGNGTLYVYPAPDTDSIASRSILAWSYVPPADLLAQADVPQFPNEWYAALKWGLARELFAEYPVSDSLAARVEKRAEVLLAELEDWGDNETGGTMFVPDYRGLTRGYP